MHSDNRLTITIKKIMYFRRKGKFDVITEKDFF